MSMTPTIGSWVVVRARQTSFCRMMALLSSAERRQLSYSLRVQQRRATPSPSLLSSAVRQREEPFRRELSCRVSRCAETPRPFHSLRRETILVEISEEAQ